MKLFLIRHSNAVDEAAELADEHRYLSAKGRDVARRIGQRLREQGVRFGAVVTSPLVRAVQTAEILAEAVGFEQPVIALPSLAPGMSVRRAAEEIGAIGSGTACVGHEPSISALAALLGSRTSVPSFRPCQVVLVDSGKLAWTLSPDVLERPPTQK